MTSNNFALPAKWLFELRELGCSPPVSKMCFPCTLGTAPAPSAGDPTDIADVLGIKFRKNQSQQLRRQFIHSWTADLLTKSTQAVALFSSTPKGLVVGPSSPMTQTPLEIVTADPKFSESRKVSLYSNFQRLKETNEYGYAANILAWKGVLTHCVQSHCFANKTILDTAGLSSALTDSKNGAPMALNVVVNEMVDKKELIPLVTWLTSKRPLLRSEWSVAAALGSVGNWAWSQVFSTAYNSGSPGKLKPQQFVCIEAVKPVANKFFQTLTQKSKLNGGTITSKVFNAQDLDLTSEDIEVCVAYLNRELQKNICFDSTKEIVVLASESSEEYQTIASIHRQMTTLASRSDSLQLKIQELTAQAKAAVKAKQTPLAKQRLRSKNEAEKTLSKTLDLYSQLETVLNNVDIASDQSSAIDILGKSSRLLKSVNSAVGGVDRVEQLVDEIAEGVADTEEVSSELAKLSIEGDNEAIEEELEALERQEVEKKVPKMPSVPTSSPKHEMVAEKKPASELETV